MYPGRYPGTPRVYTLIVMNIALECIDSVVLVRRRRLLFFHFLTMQVDSRYDPTVCPADCLRAV